MKDKLSKKLAKICILNDSQREQIDRLVTVYGLNNCKDYSGTSILKVLAVAVYECDQSQTKGISLDDIQSLTDVQLLEALPYQFNARSIALNGLAVWNYS